MIKGNGELLSLCCTSLLTVNYFLFISCGTHSIDWQCIRIVMRSRLSEFVNSGLLKISIMYNVDCLALKTANSSALECIHIWHL